MRPISLKDKLILFFFFLGISIVIITGVVSFHIARKSLIKRTFNQLTSHRIAKRDQLEGFMAKRKKEVEYFIRSGEFSSVFSSMASGKKYLNKIQLSPTNEALQIPWDSTVLIFGRFLLSGSDYTGIEALYCIHDTCYYSSLGKNIQASQAVCESFSEYRKQFLDFGTKDTIILAELSGSLPSELFFLAIQKNDDELKMLSFCLSSESINSILLPDVPNSGLGRSGEIYLVGRDCILKSNSRFIRNDESPVVVNTRACQLTLAGADSTAIIDDYRGIKVLSSFSSIDLAGLKWIIIAEIDLEEALMPVKKLQNSIILVSIFISLILIFLAFIISKRITRPVESLIHSTRMFNLSDRSIEIERKSNDEIGELAQAFQSMVERIDKQASELEQEKLKGFQAMIDGQEMERRRVSREIHDGLGQMIVALKFRLESVKDSNPEDFEQGIENAEHTCDDIIMEIRRISKALIPPVLEELGMNTALENIFSELKSQGMKANFKSDIREEKIEDIQKTYVYRIVQECIKNTIEHSGADTVSLLLSDEGDFFRMIYKDNGSGFQLGKTNIRKGNGIQNMKDRTQLLNGVFRINSMTGIGTEILITIPYAKF